MESGLYFNEVGDSFRQERPGDILAPETDTRLGGRNASGSARIYADFKEFEVESCI